MSGGLARRLWRAIRMDRAAAWTALVCLGLLSFRAAAQPAGAPVPRAGVFQVAMEHLVIRPASAGEGSGFDVLDVLRVERAGSPSEQATFILPLVAGYESLRVLDGLVPQSQATGPDFLSGYLAGEGSGAVTVAVAYRVPHKDRGEPWLLLRPYPVGALILMVHPDLSVAVAGARAAGELEVDGTRYQTYVREGLGPGAALALTVGPRAGTAASPPPRGLLAGAGWGAAGALAAAGATAAWYRRRAALQAAGAGSGARVRDRLADEVLALDAEFAAGYLEEARYRQRRQEALARLARWLAAAEGPPSSRPAGSDGGRPGGAAA